MRGTVLLFLGVVIGINISSSKALRYCYNCVGVASSADCDKITKCGDHQECFEEEVIVSTNVLFNSGCRSKTVCPTSKRVPTGKRGSVVACSKCCDKDFCNVGLCGPVHSRGLRCLSCKEPTLRASDCDHIEQCDEDNICYAHRTLIPSDMEPRYATGCMPIIQCGGLVNAPYINQCFECCDTAMCNLYKCGRNWTAVYHTSNRPSITEATATPTRTANNYNVSIHGPTSVAYHGNGSLQCTSNAHNASYTWKLNEETILSEHDNSLYIYNMTEANVGTYKCIVSKDGASAQANTTVTITEARPAVISVSSSPRPAQIGKELNIYCQVTGYPVPAVHWIFTDSQRQSFVPPNVQFPTNGTAHFESFDPAMYSGNWTCVAINNLGTGIADIIIN